MFCFPCFVCCYISRCTFGSIARNKFDQIHLIVSLRLTYLSYSLIDLLLFLCLIDRNRPIKLDFSTDMLERITYAMALSLLTSQNIFRILKIFSKLVQPLHRGYCLLVCLYFIYWVKGKINLKYIISINLFCFKNWWLAFLENIPHKKFTLLLIS